MDNTEYRSAVVAMTREKLEELKFELTEQHQLAFKENNILVQHKCMILLSAISELTVLVQLPPDEIRRYLHH
jgi:hypothetical protein